MKGHYHEVTTRSNVGSIPQGTLRNSVEHTSQCCAIKGAKELRYLFSHYHQPLIKGYFQVAVSSWHF